MKSKTTCLLKRAIETRFKIFRSEILRITSLIALIKQFNRLKFIQNPESIPQENSRVVELLEAILPAEDVPENYLHLEIIGAPQYVTEERVGDNIIGLIGRAIERTCSTSVRSTLESVNKNIFEPSSEISDISSVESSNDSPPQQVPDIDIPGEPNTKKRKHN